MEDFSDVPQLGPSINRKGGVRLHPVRDGVIPTVREAHLTRRDRGGNLFEEVTDPSTGFCQRVTSPLLNTDLPSVIEGRPVVPTRNPVRDAGLLPQPVGNGVWVQGAGSRRRVLRTVALGDALLPSAPGGNRTPSRKGSRTVATEADSVRPPRAPSIPRDLIDAFIRTKAASLGKPNVKITKEMRKLARLEIARQQDIARFCGEVPE